MPRVLLADHHPTSRRVVELSFAEEDVEVVSFDNGAAALDYLRANPVDLVLADVSLPAVSGYELCREVRSNGRNSRAPVILLVGRFDPFDMPLAEEVGYHSRLTKPIEPHNLVDLVRRLTGADRPQPRHEPSARPTVLFSQMGERRSGMLFDIPLQEGTEKVVFPLKVYQCEPSAALMRRDAVVPPEESAPVLEAEPEPEPLPEPQEAYTEPPQPLEVPEEALAEAEPSPEPQTQDDEVDRVMSRLSEKLPDVIRAILQEERKS